MATGGQRILDACVRLAAAADVAAWGAASPALYQNCLGVLRKTLPPSAAGWLQQHGFSRALTSAVAAGLRILQQLLNSSNAGGDQTMQLAKDILQLITITNCWGEDTFLPIEGAGHRAQALSADFACAAAAACGTLARLLPELTQQELAAQQRYEQQAGRAARRHGRSKTDHYPPSARLVAFVRLSSELLRLWADLSVVFDEQPQPHKPQPVVAPSPAAAAAEGQAASQGNAFAAAGSAPTEPTNISGSHSRSATTGSGGSGAAVFHEYIGHAAPLAAAVVHSWQLLQHSAARNAAWAASEQMQQLDGPAAGVKQVVAMRMAADMFQSFTKASSNRTAARAVLSQLSPQLPWLLMYCMAACTAAMYEARQGMLPVNLPAAPSPSTTPSASSRHSSAPSELQMPPYHAMLLDALWLPGGPHPPELTYQRSATVKMPQNVLVPVLYVLTEYLGGSAPVLPAQPFHGSGSTSSTNSISTSSASTSSTTSSTSSPLQSTTARAAAGDGSLTAAPGTPVVPPFWWGLSLQTLLLLPPLVAECVALEDNPWMLTVAVRCLKSLHRGLQALQQQQQQQQQAGLSSPAHQAGGCSGGSWGDTAATPHMLEAAAQLVVPAAQRTLAAAASDAERDRARQDLQEAYGLITANIGPSTFLTQGSWQVPGPAVLAALEAAVRAASSPSSPPQATVCSLGRTVLDTVAANATAMRDAAACGLAGSHGQGPARQPGLPAGVSCQEGPSQQQHNSSGTATPSTDAGCSSQPQAGPQAAALVRCPGGSGVTDAWAGLLASCLKATATSCCRSADNAAGCMAQPNSSSVAGAQPAAGGSSPATAQPSADEAAGFSAGAVSAILGAAYAASQWHPDAAAAAAPTAGANGCSSSSTASRRGGVGCSPGPAGSSEGDGSSSQDQGCSPSPNHQVNATDGQQLQPQLPPGWGFVISKALYHAGSLLAASRPQPPSAAPAGASVAAVEAAHELAACVPAPAVRVVLGLFASACEGVRGMVQHLAPADVLEWKQVQLLGLVDALSDAVTQAEVLLLGMGCAAGQGFVDQTLAAKAAMGSQAGDASQLGLQVSAWALLLGSPAAQQLSEALLSLGAALCACLPSKTACNHPACTQLDKVSEAQLVSGKGKRCSGCMLARYCCAEHQALHWNAHKVACRALAAARPAAGSSSLGQKKVKSQIQAK